MTAPPLFTSSVQELPLKPLNLFAKPPSEPNFTPSTFSSDPIGRPPSSANSNPIGFTLENSVPTFQSEQSVLQHQINPSPPPPPPSVQPFFFNTEDSPLVENSPSVNQSVDKTDADQPIFFSIDKVPVTTKPALGKSENPYSKSKIGRTAVYKNPSLIPFAERVPVILDSAIPTINGASNLENIKKDSFQPNIGSFFSPSSTGQNFTSNFVSNSSIDFNQSTVQPTIHKEELSSYPVPINHSEALKPQATPLQPPHTSEPVFQGHFDQGPLLFNPANVQPIPSVHPTKHIEGFATDPVSIDHPEALKPQGTPLQTPFAVESVFQNHFVQEPLLFNPTNVQPIPSVKQIEGLATDPVSTEHPEAPTTQLTPLQTPSESVFQGHFNQEPLLFNQVNVQPIPPVNFFENKENQQSGPEIVSKLFEDLSTNSIWPTVSGNLNNNKVSADSNEETNTCDSNRNNPSNVTDTVIQRNDNEIPRFNQDLSENSLFCINNNSALVKTNQIEKQYPTFFDTTTSATNNSTLENKNNNSLLYYFSNPTEERLTNEEIVTDDSHPSVNVPQTSSFSSFRSESDSELNQVSFRFY